MSTYLNRIVSPGYKARPPGPCDLSDPKMAFHYALNVLRGPWPEGEAIIATHGFFSYQYALEVLGGRFLAGEPAVIQDKHIIAYAKHIIRGRWPEAEKYLLQRPAAAHRYAVEIVQARWQEAEPHIARSPAKDYYLRDFPDAKSDWVAFGLLDWITET